MNRQYYAKKFIRFLKFNRLYTRFCTIYKRCRWYKCSLMEHLENSNPEWYLDSFDWDLDTDLGFNCTDFWSEVEDKWEAVLAWEEEQ